MFSRLHYCGELKINFQFPQYNIISISFKHYHKRYDTHYSQGIQSKIQGRGL